MAREVEMTEFDDCECVAETPDALCIRGVKDEDVWVPKSLVSVEDSEVRKLGDSGILVVQEWFAIKEGWA